MTGKRTSTIMWNRNFAFAEGDQRFWQIGPFQLWATALPSELRLASVRGDDRLEIKEVFDREGIEIPFPHRSLYAGSVTEPFPVHLVDIREDDRRV